MRGVRLGSGDWGLTVRFADAGGLAVRSPVTYRGIVVGAVKAIRVTRRRWWPIWRSAMPICACRCR